MRRSTRIVVVSIVVGLLAVGLAYFCSMRLSARQTNNDDLAWLRREFHLTDTEMNRIRQLHEGYLPKCGEMCAKIAAKRREVEAALANDAQGTAVAEQKLVELGALRAQCQGQMLRHFQEVSQAMPPDQGKRYLEEMQRLTLGSHEQIEKSMGDAHSGHVHGDH
jgi:hypothetical protein